MNGTEPHLDTFGDTFTEEEYRMLISSIITEAIVASGSIDAKAGYSGRGYSETSGRNRQRESAGQAKSEKSPAQKERCVLARAMYLYIQENHESGYAMKWSEWLEAHSRTLTMKTGESLEEECFSSALLIVSDSFEALDQGTATVLSGDGIAYITVIGS